MATVLDLSLLGYFSVVFSFILVWTLVFALLQKTRILGEKAGLNVLVAVAVAFLVSLSDNVVQIINFMIPWFTIAIIFFVLLLLIFQIFGATEKDIFSYIKTDRAVGWVIIGVVLVIIGASFANVFGQKLTQAAFEGGTAINVSGAGGVATPSFQQNIYATLFHPKVLGMMVLFVIAIFAIALLSQG